MRWVEEGEKNSKFFLNLEKRNYINKLITQLEIDNKLVTDQNEILLAQRNFYKNLYSENLDVNSNIYKNALEEFTFKDLPQLNEESKAECDKIITEKELHSCLKELKNEKTPGTDGFPSEFYKFFWLDIKELLLDSINYAFEIGQLSIEQKRGLITLIPKN